MSFIYRKKRKNNKKTNCFKNRKYYAMREKLKKEDSERFDYEEAEIRALNKELAEVE